MAALFQSPVRTVSLQVCLSASHYPGRASYSRSCRCAAGRDCVGDSRQVPILQVNSVFTLQCRCKLHNGKANALCNPVILQYMHEGVYKASAYKARYN